MAKRSDFMSFKLSEIDKLTLLILVCKPRLEHDIKMRLGELGGRVLLSRPAKGVSRKPILEILGLASNDEQVVFGMTRAQDCSHIVYTLGTEFEFEKPGVGKIFAVDVDGYLGAKGPYVEG